MPKVRFFQPSRSLSILIDAPPCATHRAGDSYTRTHHLVISRCHYTWWWFIIEFASGAFTVPVHFDSDTVLGYSSDFFPAHRSGRAPRPSLGTYEVPHPDTCGAPPVEGAAVVAPSFTSAVQASFVNSLLIIISSPVLKASPY